MSRRARSGLQHAARRAGQFNQLAGLNMAADRGLNGDPYGNQSRQLGMQTMNGDFLHSNPYLDLQIDDTAHNMTTVFQNGTAAQNDAMFNRAGAFGGGSWQNKQSQDAMGLASPLDRWATKHVHRITTSSADSRPTQWAWPRSLLQGIGRTSRVLPGRVTR
jgi:hypothetical protein